MPKKAPLQNGYEDEDFQQVLNEIEGFEEEKRTIRAEAAGKCSALAKKIEDAKKTASNLNIPKKVLNGVLKMRGLERQLQDIADNVPGDLAEVYVDASGQFSMFAPADGEKPSKEPSATKAARQAADRAKANQADEQKEGGRVLDEMAVH